MQRNPWMNLKRTVANWRVWALPGLMVIGLVVAARLAGSLQGLELLALDAFLKARSPEPEDDRIVLIGLDEAALKQTGYPIREQALVELLNTLQSQQPAIIGLHILPNQIAPMSQTALLEKVKQRQNLIVAENMLLAADQIPPPLGFSAKQIGFIDIVLDPDSRLRRIILGSFGPLNLKDYKLSFTTRLAERYLTSLDKALKLDNGIRDPEAMRFGATEIPRVFPDTGAYISVDHGNPQMLLNVRSGPTPFRMLSFEAIQTGRFKPEWIRDRIVIVGITDPTIRPNIPTAATSGTNSLQIQAHAVSQITSAVLDQRLLLTTWPSHWEYIWIVVWGCVGVALSRRLYHPVSLLLIVGIANLLLVVISYTALVGAGLWLPIIPVLLALNLSVIFPAVYEYVYEQEKVLKSRLDERQRTIEQTFNTIHNGPLQTLATLLRQMRDRELPQAEVLPELERLNFEIRNVGEHLKQETLTQEETLYLRDGVKLDLTLPAHELFYEVYSNTLDRPDFSQFETLKVASDFDAIDPNTLSLEQRQDLCRFLEEALCNVGKHAEGATRLTVTGTQTKGWYTLRIMDDGPGIHNSAEGEGTRYARRVATKSRGHFKRESLSPNGTLCELSIPLTKSWWRR